MDMKAFKKHVLRLLKENEQLKKQIRYDLKTAISKAQKDSKS